MTKKETKRLLKRAIYIYSKGLFTKDETIKICCNTIREYMQENLKEKGVI